MGTKTTRIDKWDNYKLLLILLVVIGHLMKAHLDYSRTARIAYWFIYLFHMPAFIMVSGMFAKASIRAKRYDRAYSFLILYFLIKILMFLFRMINGDRISMSLLSASGIEWYAFALFVYYLLTMFLQQFEKKQMLFLAIAMGCVAAYDSSIGDKFVLARMITFYPFFLSGFYMESDKVITFTEKKWFKIVAIIAVLIAAAVSVFYVDEVYWTIDLIKGNESYRAVARDIRSFSVLFRLAQYIISMLLTFSVLALVPSGKLPFSYIGRRTLPIYALHYIVIDFLYKTCNVKDLLQSVSAQYYEFLLIPIGILIVAILSAKPFVVFVNRIVVPRPAAENLTKK